MKCKECGFSNSVKEVDGELKRPEKNFIKTDNNNEYKCPVCGAIVIDQHKFQGIIKE